METRILIAVILSLGLVVAYQELVLKRLYPPPQKQSAGKTAPPAPAASPEQEPSHALSLPASQAHRAAATSVTSAQERKVEVDTDLYQAVFTSRGASLESFKLKKFREEAAADSPPYEMVKPTPNGSRPLGVVIKHGDANIDDQSLEYTTDAPGHIEVNRGDKTVVTFSATTKDGLILHKTFTFSAGSYAFDMAVEESDHATAGDTIGLTMEQPLTAHSGYYNIPEIQAYIAGTAMVEAQKALTKGVPPATGPITYAGFGDRYFLSVYMPKNPDHGRLEMSFDGEQAEAEVLFPGTQRLDLLVYFGPKQIDAMEAVSPLLTKSIDFGWTSLLALALLRTLKFLHSVAPNYGVDIILLTLAIRLALLPMSIRSQRSMIRMQRLQPQIAKIREKFADDNERLQREMVDLYKRNHVNPLGGCAPMILQLPVFIGLYEALLNSVELRHSPFIGWIRDLSTPDCLVIPGMPKLPLTSCGGLPVLVLLMGASTFLQQWMTPTSPDPNQQRMMMLSPIIFTVMFVNFPAGLSLYYFASNVLGIIQQFVLNREFKQLPPATA